MAASVQEAPDAPEGVGQRQGGDDEIDSASRRLARAAREDNDRRGRPRNPP